MEQENLLTIKSFQRQLIDFISFLNTNEYSPKAAIQGDMMRTEIQILINKLEQ